MTTLNDLDKNGVYYLASPYTSPNPDIMKQRYLKIDEIAYNLMMEGFHLIEPIGSTHHKAQRFKLPSEYSFWKKQCRAMVGVSNGVIVAMLDGWKESVGVQDEIKIATELGKPVIYLKTEE
jgi:hypothetical protein